MSDEWNAYANMPPMNEPLDVIIWHPEEKREEIVPAIQKGPMATLFNTDTGLPIRGIIGGWRRASTRQSDQS